MNIHALVMAGGRGSRLLSDREKPLIPILGKPMIDHVVESLLATRSVREIAATTSPFTPRTREYLLSRGIPVVKTSGAGFVKDLKEAFYKLKIKETLVVSCDLPGIRTQVFEKAIETYFRQKKPALCVAVPKEKFVGAFNEEVGISNGLCAVGINVIDGSGLEADNWLDQYVLILEVMNFVNVNAPEDIIAAEKLLARTTASWPSLLKDVTGR